MDNERFEHILRQRYAPSMPDGLQARIIAASAAVPRRQSVFAYFIMPRPALSLLVVLVFGLLLGAWSTDIGVVDNDYVLPLFFAADDTYNNGGFL